MSWDALAGVEDVAWASLRTRRGTAASAPRMLRALAGDDQDAREEAWGFLQDELWHQGTLYEACAPAMPFIVRLALDRSLTERVHLIEYSVVIAGSAHRAAHTGVLDALGRCLEELGTLLDDPVTGGGAALVLGCLRARSTSVVTMLSGHAGQVDAPQLYLALVLQQALPPAMRARAEGNLRSSNTALAIAAAYLLRMLANDLADDVKEAVDWLATPARVKKLAEACMADWIDLPMPPLAPARGPLEPASVVFASSNLVVAHHPARGRFTLKMVETGLSSGDLLRLGGFTHVTVPVARIAEYTGADGKIRRFEFDELGTPIRSG